MEALARLIGMEHDFGQVGAALCRFAAGLRADVIGAYHLTCSDESEREVEAAFDRHFVARVLPELKPGHRVAFRSVNLGARYEWGAVRIAEGHFATPRARQGVKLLVAKVNTHVAIHEGAEEPEFGWLDRYGNTSACCGALRGMLEGSPLPGVCELRDAMAHDGYRRPDVLSDADRVPPAAQALYAAMAASILQSRRIVHDIGEYRPESPTIFLVLPCVTLNRSARDTELVLGQFGIDRTGGEAQTRYVGLGDDPAEYRHHQQQQRLVVSDAHWPGA